MHGKLKIPSDKLTKQVLQAMNTHPSMTESKA